MILAVLLSVILPILFALGDYFLAFGGIGVMSVILGMARSNPKEN